MNSLQGYGVQSLVLIYPGDHEPRHLITRAAKQLGPPRHGELNATAPRGGPSDAASEATIRCAHEASGQVSKLSTRSGSDSIERMESAQKGAKSTRSACESEPKNRGNRSTSEMPFWHELIEFCRRGDIDLLYSSKRTRARHSLGRFRDRKARGGGSAEQLA